MSEQKKRNIHNPEFKAETGLEALRRVKMINEIARTVVFIQPRNIGKIKSYEVI